MKVLLIQPPHYYEGRSRQPCWFPLGLGYIAKVMTKAGHQVEILDVWAHQRENEELTKIIQRLGRYDVIGITALSTQYAYVKWLIKQLKASNSAKIVLGGALATLSTDIVLENTEADICVIGEGEITFKEVVENIDRIANVKGIYFKDGSIVRNPSRSYIENLDSIDFPAWDMFPMEIYLRHCTVEPDIKAMNVVTGRGCPYSCRFCSKVFTMSRYRSVDNIIEEIKELKRRYGIGGIVFNDELLIINKPRLYELCDKIEPLNIKWNCQGRANLVDLDLLKRMKKAGCVHVGYGIESGSQRILNNMNKQQTVEQAQRALRDTVKAGMRPVVQLMYGYPGETRDTLQETVRFFKEAPYLGPYGISKAGGFSVAQYSPTTALPGTELYDQALKQGLIKDEDKYLEALSVGYIPCAEHLLVNFTDFNEKEYWQLRQEIAQRIVSDNIRSHPLHLVRDLVKGALGYLKRHGPKETIKEGMEILSILWRQAGGKQVWSHEDSENS